MANDIATKREKEKVTACNRIKKRKETIGE